MEENKYDLTSFNPSTSKGIEKFSTREGVMSIINAKTGKRVTLAKKLLEEIQCENEIQFSFGKEAIAIAKQLPNNENFFVIKHGKGKGYIYSTALVNEITKQYKLDFINRTSN